MISDPLCRELIPIGMLTLTQATHTHSLTHQTIPGTRAVAVAGWLLKVPATC